MSCLCQLSVCCLGQVSISCQSVTCLSRNQLDSFGPSYRYICTCSS